MYIGKDIDRLEKNIEKEEKEKYNYDIKEIVEKAFNEKIKKCQKLRIK